MTTLETLTDSYQARHTAEQKRAFREYAVGFAESRGVPARVEKSGGKHDNVVIGDPTSAKVVLTAHYDTPNASLFPNVMMPRSTVLFWLYQFVPVIFLLIFSLVPAYLIGVVALNDYRVYMIVFLVLYFGLFILTFKGFVNKNNANDNSSGVATVLGLVEKLGAGRLNDVAFILFDNEEKGKLGSKAYFKEHKAEMSDRLVVNFDCVGFGREVIFIASAAAEASEEYAKIREAVVSTEDYNVSFFPSKGSQANSDHKSFPKGVCCLACKRSKRGILYTPYIHTAKDVVCDPENVAFLVDGVSRGI